MQQMIFGTRLRLLSSGISLLFLAVLTQNLTEILAEAITPAGAKSPERGFSVAAAEAAEVEGDGDGEGQKNDASPVVSLTAPSFLVSNQRPKQGEVIDFSAASGEEAEFLGKRYKLFAAEDGRKHCLIAMPVLQKPGPAVIRAQGGETTVTILDGHFPVQRLTLPKSKDNFDMAKGEKEAVEGAKGTLSPSRMWRGNFTLPSKARISSGFGMRRIVNGKLLDDYFHSGYDFAGWLGSPIMACAPGKVVLARGGFKLHGNTVAIDHGQGVVSFYIHMSKILVKEGQEVSAGQQIGAVGATGRASGPHLHFSIYVNQTASNPGQWFKKAP